jgi:Family of unknown function (DUF6118)
MSVEVEQADSATQAFADMRDKIAGLTRAVDSMAGEWKALEIPDYGETLDKIAEELAATAEKLEALAEKPGLKLTPTSLSEAIITAGKAARAEDHAALDRAISAFNQTEKEMTGSLVSARSAQTQDKRLRRVSMNCTILGMVLWALLPGPIMRAMPQSWLLPERLAVRAIGGDKWNAGQRVLALANPERWLWLRAIDDESTMGKRALINCFRIANKVKQQTPCEVYVRRMDATLR